MQHPSYSVATGSNHKWYDIGMDALSLSMLITLVPMALVVLLKTNAGLLFFAATAGIVLLSTLDSSVIATAGSVLPGVGEAYVRLAVVIATLALTAVFFAEKVHGTTSLVLHSVISVLIGVMLWLLLPEATGVTWLVDGIDNEYWQDINRYSTLIIAVTFGLSVLTVLPPHNKRSKRRKKSSH